MDEVQKSRRMQSEEPDVPMMPAARTCRATSYTRRSGGDLWHCAFRDVHDRLRSRLAEINSAAFAHMLTNSDARDRADPHYQAGLHNAVVAVVDYWLAGIGSNDDSSELVPPSVFSQIRYAVRGGARLEDVLLRCVALHRLLGEFLLDEIEEQMLDGPILRQLRGIEVSVFERLIRAVANTYTEEHDRLMRSGEAHRRDVVLKLLAGESASDDTMAALHYEMHVWHVALIADGTDADRALRRVASSLGCQLLLIGRGEQHRWAWLGGSRKLAVTDFERALSAHTADVTLAIGDPARDLDGWRLTHAQAQAAWRVALRRPRPITRCADVLLDAAVLQNEALAVSLTGAYLAPLDRLRMGGAVARETLNAYCNCERSVSSSAHRLGVTRKTVESRLREIERALGRPLRSCVTELEVALRLELHHTTSSPIP